MKCREVRMTLVAYLDGEVAPSERTAIDVHVARCSSCEKELAALGRTRIHIVDGMRRLASEAAPSKNAWTRLQAVMVNEGASSARAAVSKPIGRRALSRKWRVALVAMATVLLAGGVVAAVPSARSAAGEFLANILNLNSYRVTPTEAGYLPEGFDPVPVYQVGMVDVPSGGGEDISDDPGAQDTPTEQLLYRSADRFLFVRTSPDSGDPLPEGQATEVNGNDAVLITGLSGSVSPPEQLVADQGASVATDPRYSVTYQDASVITWAQGGTRVEVLSNLPAEEVQKVAEGLVVGGQERVSP